MSGLRAAKDLRRRSSEQRAGGYAPQQSGDASDPICLDEDEELARVLYQSEMEAGGTFVPDTVDQEALAVELSMMDRGAVIPSRNDGGLGFKQVSFQGTRAVESTGSSGRSTDDGRSRGTVRKQDRDDITVESPPLRAAHRTARPGLLGAEHGTDRMSRARGGFPESAVLRGYVQPSRTGAANSGWSRGMAGMPPAARQDLAMLSEEVRLL